MKGKQQRSAESIEINRKQLKAIWAKVERMSIEKQFQINLARNVLTKKRDKITTT
jgi:CBS-domain-containing membrane protein